MAEAVILWLLPFGKLFVSPLRLTVAGFPAPAVPPALASGLQILFYLIPAVLDLLKEYHGIILIPYYGDTGILCTRVDLDPVGIFRFDFPCILVL